MPAIKINLPKKGIHASAQNDVGGGEVVIRLPAGESVQCEDVLKLIQFWFSSQESETHGVKVQVDREKLASTTPWKISIEDGEVKILAKEKDWEGFDVKARYADRSKRSAERRRRLASRVRKEYTEAFQDRTVRLAESLASDVDL